MGGLWGWPKTPRLWAKRVFSFRQDFPVWLQGNWSWVPHELCCPQFSPHLPPPSSSNAGKQLGLCVAWVFSSSLCFYLLFSIYRVAMVLSVWVDAGRVVLFLVYFGCVFPELQPLQSQVEMCWGVLAAGFSSALSGSVYQWGKENAVHGSDPELKVLFSPWQQSWRNWH